MIKKLNESYRESLFQFLKKEPEINLFIIGDIENFGFEQDFQEIWADLDEKNNYRGVLLRYHSHFIFYAEEGQCDLDGFCKIIESSPEKTDIAGEFEVLGKILIHLNYRKKKEQYFAKLATLSNLQKPEIQLMVEKALPADACELLALREAITEFADYKTTVENIRTNLENGSGRTFVVRQDGKIVAAASTTAENSTSAMVVSVMTHPENRVRGYATACVANLCEELLKEGKSLCLFYNNPRAGSIYHKLGFVTIGRWVSVVF